MINIETSPTLLAKLQDKHNSEARERFIDVYGRIIEGLAVHFGARGKDVQEITSEVILRILQKIFQYKPEKGKFRAWLTAVIHNAWEDFRRQTRRAQSVGGSDWIARIHELPAQQEFEKRIDEGSILYLFCCAIDEVKRIVTAVQWACFAGFFIDEKSSAELAKELGISVASVFQNNKRVKDQLLAIFTRLKNENT
jgi:RNA polymerase sigma factor (sigma-70 family)